MVLGAMIDAGVSVDALNSELAKLKFDGWSLFSETGQRAGVTGTRVSVKSNNPNNQIWRIEDFISITKKSRLPSQVVNQACSVFNRLGEAEASAHGLSSDQIQLHELGDADTIFDVVGCTLGLWILEVEKLYCSPLPSGSGTIQTAHGIIPVPSPATTALLVNSSVSIIPPPANVSYAGEMITPTGVAIVTTLATFRQPSMTLDSVGYGLGSRDPDDYPNVLGIWVGEESNSTYVSGFSMLETNIDDMNPEILAYVQERLFALGALDVWISSIGMKKNRLGSMLSVLVSTEHENEAVKMIMRETTSFGVRVRSVARYEANREIVQLETSLGVVPVKLKQLDGTCVGVSPEYEACRIIALEKGIPLQDVYRIIQSEALSQLL